MKTELTIKDLCGYLPHGLKVLTNRYGIELVIGLHGDKVITTEDDNYIGYVNPLLIPLSALTEPLPDGTIPIVELAKIEKLIEPISFNIMVDHIGKQRGICAKDRFNNQWLMFNFENGFSMWHKPHNEIDHRPTLLDNQIQLLEYLYSIHADIKGLIDAGLAIDKRTIK